jgi:hypothetical protein
MVFFSSFSGYRLQQGIPKDVSAITKDVSTAMVTISATAASAAKWHPGTAQ